MKMECWSESKKQIILIFHFFHSILKQTSRENQSFELNMTVAFAKAHM